MVKLLNLALVLGINKGSRDLTEERDALLRREGGLYLVVKMVV
jgi:hypothetical protein